jgi:hypothetical protein
VATDGLRHLTQQLMNYREVDAIAALHHVILSPHSSPGQPLFVQSAAFFRASRAMKRSWSTIIRS